MLQLGKKRAQSSSLLAVTALGRCLPIGASVDISQRTDSRPSANGFSVGPGLDYPPLPALLMSTLLEGFLRFGEKRSASRLISRMS